MHTMVIHRVGTDIAKVDVQIRIPAERSGLQIPATQFFSPPKRPDRLWSLTGTGGFFPGAERKGVMLKAHLHLVANFRVNGFIPLLPLHGFMPW